MRFNPKFRRRICFLIILCLLNIIWFPSCSQAKAQQGQGKKTFLPTILVANRSNFYIDSVNGLDSNPGTSVDRAWKSFAPIQSRHFLPGSTIFLKRGSTFTGQLTLSSSGTASLPIKITSYDNGPKPIIRNPGTADHLTKGILLTGSWIVVENITVTNTSGVGIHTFAGADHNTIQNMDISNVGIGINLEGGYNLIQSNYIHDLHMIINTPGGTDDYGAVGVSLESANNEVAFNRMVRCIAKSYDFGTDGGAVEWYGKADSNYVHHNWAESNDGFLEVGGDARKSPTNRNSIVAYNISTNNHAFVTIHNDRNDGSLVENFRVENNTIFETYHSTPRRDLIWFSNQPTITTLLFRNNIVSLDGNLNLATYPTFTHTYNLYHLSDSSVDNPLPYAQGQGEKIGDPLFVDPAKLNFHLKAASPAREAGTDLGYTFDLDRYPIPRGQKPDLGAYEYH